MGGLSAVKEDDRELEAAENEIYNKELGDKLRAKLALMQVILENRDATIQQWAAQYKIASLPVDKGKTLNRPTTSGQQARRSSLISEHAYGITKKGSVSGETKRTDELIVIGLKNASTALKEEVFNTPRFTFREVETFANLLKKKATMNGLLDKKLFTSLIKKVFKKKIKHPASYANMMFRLLDVRSLGFIRSKDFIFIMAIFCIGNDALRLKALFVSADIDWSGELSIQELNILVSMIFALDFENADADSELTESKMVELILLELDENFDGSVTMKEFQDACRDKEDLKETFLGMPDKFHKVARVRRESKLMTAEVMLNDEETTMNPTSPEFSEDASKSPFRDRMHREVSNPLFGQEIDEDEEESGTEQDADDTIHEDEQQPEYEDEPDITEPGNDDSDNTFLTVDTDVVDEDQVVGVNDDEPIDYEPIDDDDKPSDDDDDEENDTKFGFDDDEFE